jgi:hypothetical protein
MRSPPDLPTALPIHFVRPSRTRKLLSPILVLLTVVILAIASMVGICVAIVVLSTSGSRTGSVVTSQGFGVIAVSSLPSDFKIVEGLS